MRFQPSCSQFESSFPARKSQGITKLETLKSNFPFRHSWTFYVHVPWTWKKSTLFERKFSENSTSPPPIKKSVNRKLILIFYRNNNNNYYSHTQHFTERFPWELRSAAFFFIFLHFPVSKKVGREKRFYGTRRLTAIANLLFRSNREDSYIFPSRFIYENFCDEYKLTTCMTIIIL